MGVVDNERGSVAPRRVVVVDDDFDIRAMLTVVLEMEGYQVVAASNGREALHRMRNGQPVALVLLDLMMPVMNGWQFRAAQIADPSIAAVPVVVLSGAGNVPRETAAIDVAGYLRKPIDLDALLATVKRYCHELSPGEEGGLGARTK